jgi:serine/threonine protein kinase
VEAFSMSRVGTKFYMSPELVRKEPYGMPADVYSMGVVLWEIFALSSPRDYYRLLRDQHEEAERQRQRKPLSSSLPSPSIDFPTLRLELKEGRVTTQPWLPMCECWSEAIRTLIGSCLSNDPNERPTMQHMCHVLDEEMVRASATLDCSNNANTNHHQVVARRRSTFRLDLSNLHLVVNNGEDETASQEGDEVCCGTSTTTNVTAMGGADVPPPPEVTLPTRTPVSSTDGPNRQCIDYLLDI